MFAGVAMRPLVRCLVDRSIGRAEIPRSERLAPYVISCWDCARLKIFLDEMRGRESN